MACALVLALNRPSFFLLGGAGRRRLSAINFMGMAESMALFGLLDNYEMLDFSTAVLLRL